LPLSHLINGEAILPIGVQIGVQMLKACRREMCHVFVLSPVYVLAVSPEGTIQLGSSALVTLFRSLHGQRWRAEQALAARTRQQAAIAERSQASVAGLDLDLLKTTVARVSGLPEWSSVRSWNCRQTARPYTCGPARAGIPALWDRLPSRPGRTPRPA
jgi:hypothetical protein